MRKAINPLPVIGVLVAMFVGSFATQAVANAPRPDWKRVLQGVDGVIVYCLASDSREFAVEMCGRLSEATITAFTGSRLRAVHTGVVYTGVDVQPNNPTDPAPFKQAPGISAPLVIRLLVTGTRGGNPGIAGGIAVSRPFRGAVVAGSGGDGLEGDLVVHERHWVAVGPRRQSIPFVIEHGARQARELVAEIRDHL